MKKLTAIFLVLLLLCGCTAPSQSPEEKEYLFVHFIDVGQGDCIFLKYGDVDILIDGGYPENSFQIIRYLTQLGVDDLELVVNTHPHGDHIGGLPGVVAAFAVEEVWTTTLNYSSYSFKSFINQAQKQDALISVPAPGDSMTIGSLTLTVLGPVKSSYEDLNDTSMVIMATFGEKRFLFTGDMEALAEGDLLASGADVKADVLKVGHHGSYSSTSKKFLDAVDPDYAVVSCGRNNDYGHPHAAPMNRLNNAAVSVFRTDTMGTVTIGTDGKEFAFFWIFGDALPTHYEDVVLNAA